MHEKGINNPSELTVIKGETSHITQITNIQTTLHSVMSTMTAVETEPLRNEGLRTKYSE